MTEKKAERITAPNQKAGVRVPQISCGRWLIIRQRQPLYQFAAADAENPRLYEAASRHAKVVALKLTNDMKRVNLVYS